MECNQQQTMVAATKTLYENFIEEKCESDLLIPDYFPAAEKIIQCCAVPVITGKEIEGDRLNLEGNCKFSIIYQGEEEGGIKSLIETVTFSESFPLKDAGNHAWTQTVVRVAGTSCRLLNPRKISAKATVSIALKVKDQQMTESIEEIDCNEAEALFVPKTVFTILDHVADTTKVQGEIEVHTDIQDILKSEGSICIKDVKLLPGKAMVKGVADIYILFTPEADPCRVESTSTAIPFTQMIDLQQQNDGGFMEAAAVIQTLRTDVETDDEGKNRLISVTATLITEGEVYDNREHRLLTDVYSNRYPINVQNGQLTVEEMKEQIELNDTVRHEVLLDSNDVEVIQVLGTPVVQKITGQDKTLSIEGILDVSMFFREGEHYRSVDKGLPFTLKKELRSLNSHMRCEVHPCVLGMDWSVSNERVDLRTELGCSMMVFSKENIDVVSSMELDVDHPIEAVKNAPLIVYYGDKGERLWDIARKYSTSVAAIKSINELDRDILEEKRLILIS
ncbi:MAG: DUF3794 domain-containing protein [Clostridia bacterium]|nr:DUF3794 domain-containing protein [Clostridia bacterium]